jgi:uncharacterized protein YuzE
MKVTYDAEVDALVVRLTDGQILESEETQAGIIVDFDADGKIVALEFLNATKQFSAKAIREFEKAA